MILLTEDEVGAIVQDLRNSMKPYHPSVGQEREGIAKAQLRNVGEWLREFDKKHHTGNSGSLFCSACEDEIWEALDEGVD